MLGVKSVNLLNPVKINISRLKNSTNPFDRPLRCVSLSKTIVIMVTEIAKTATNPVLTPKIKKSNDAISPLLVALEIEERSIFSGEANLGTLRIALAKNKTKSEMETFFTLFCNLGNRTNIARPKIIPCSNPIANAPKTKMKENTGCKKIS